MNEDKNDALNNLINSIQEKMNVSSSEKSPDISSLLNTLNSNNSSSEQSDESKTQSQGGIDPTIFLKIQQIMSAMNSNSPQKDLLLSLKPFLRKSRQDKMSDYINILNILSILDSLRDKGSE